MESFKNKSRIINIIVFAASFIVYIGADGLRNVIPIEYQYLIPTIMMIAGFILVQKSEDKRVEVAEQLIQQKNNETPLNPEYE